MLVLEIAVGAFLGQLAFSVVGLLIGRAQSRRDREQLNGLISQLQGLGEDTQPEQPYTNEFVTDGSHQDLVGV
jgi:hypothetical protein